MKLPGVGFAANAEYKIGMRSETVVDKTVLNSSLSWDAFANGN